MLSKRYRHDNLHQDPAGAQGWRESHSPGGIQHLEAASRKAGVSPILSQEEVAALLQGIRQGESALQIRACPPDPETPPPDHRIAARRRLASGFRWLSQWFAMVTELQLPLL